eukprot:jgi/Chrzof1/8960/Cz03g31020.t1
MYTHNSCDCSAALHTTSIWSNTIGLEQEQTGTNAAIEAAIYAPGGGGGGGRTARRQRAQELIQAAGYQPAVTDYEGLKALARAQHGTNANRGACKLCGGLGHLTKQCRNFLAHKLGDQADGAAAAVAAATAMPLLTADDDDDDLTDSSSDDSGSDNSSSSSDRRSKVSSTSTVMAVVYGAC